MRGRWCRLRAVFPQDATWLYELFSEDPEAYRWRFREAQPGFDEVVGRDRNTFCEYLITNVSNGEPIGYTAALNADERAGHTTICGILHPSLRSDFRAAEGFALLLDDLFMRLGFRKVYAEVFSFNHSVVRALLLVGFCEEALLKEHCFAAGQLWDLHVLSLGRSDWLEHSRRLGI